MPHGDLGTEPGTYDGPITISSGGTYSGNWEAVGAEDAITVTTTQPVIIENSYIRHTGSDSAFGGLWGDVIGVDITIRNCRFIGEMPSGPTGAWIGRTVELFRPKRFVFENNWIQHSNGIYIHRWDGGASDFLIVRFNRFRNIDGRRVNASGYELRQILQLDQCHNVANMEVAWNESINLANQSVVEDHISIYRSSGRSNSRIQIHNNLIWGAFPPTTGEAYSGGGIMCADAHAPGDPQPAGNVDAYSNVVLGCINYGIAIAAGANTKFFGNRVVGSGRNHLGQLYSAANIGIYVFDLTGDPRWDNNDAYDNWVRWWKGDVRNDWWLPDCEGFCSNTAGSPAGEVTYAHEEAEYNTWLNTTVATAGVRLGPQTASDEEEVDKIFIVDAILTTSGNKEFSLDGILFSALPNQEQFFFLDSFLIGTKEQFSLDAEIIDPRLQSQVFSIDASLTDIQDYDFKFMYPIVGWDFSRITLGGGN